MAAITLLSCDMTLIINNFQMAAVHSRNSISQRIKCTLLFKRLSAKSISTISTGNVLDIDFFLNYFKLLFAVIVGRQKLPNILADSMALGSVKEKR